MHVCKLVRLDAHGHLHLSLLVFDVVHLFFQHQNSSVLHYKG